jgi:hypothetical protein
MVVAEEAEVAAAVRRVNRASGYPEINSITSIPMKTNTVTIVGLVALGVGYLLGSEATILRSGSSTGMAPLEYFTGPATFSEVENAKATLEADAAQFINILRSKYLEQRMAHAKHRQPANAAAWADELDAKAQELRGTFPEFAIRDELLQVLLSGNLQDHWLDQYLQLVYESPTQPLVAKWLNVATRLAGTTDRMDEVESGISHLLSIPTEFETKQNLLSAAAVSARAGHKWNASLSLAQTKPVGLPQ